MSDLVRNDSQAPNGPAADGPPLSDGGQVTPANDAACCEEIKTIFERHQNELLGTLYHLLGNIDDARDALQDCFIKCWRHRHQVFELQNSRAWIFRIAMNTGRDMRGAAWRRKRQPIQDTESLTNPKEASPDAAVFHDERVARLREAIRDLRPEEQEVFLLRQNGEMTYDEIAEFLDVPTGTVKTRMRLAVTKLRQQLSESE